MLASCSYTQPIRTVCWEGAGLSFLWKWSTMLDSVALGNYQRFPMLSCMGATLLLAFENRQSSNTFMVSTCLIVCRKTIVFGASRCWRVERPQNSGRKWLPSRCLRRVGTLTRGASSKFWAQVATLSLFLTRRDAGAWSVFEIQGVSGHPLVVFGAS